MRPVGAAEGWGVPPIESVAELADWLHLAPGELAWFADLKRLSRTCKLTHYRYRFVQSGRAESG